MVYERKTWAAHGYGLGHDIFIFLPACSTDLLKGLLGFEGMGTKTIITINEHGP